MQPCQIILKKNTVLEGAVLRKMCLFHEKRKGKRYLKEQLFLHHLFSLADETLLQGVNFLYQLVGSGVTGLFKGTK